MGLALSSPRTGDGRAETAGVIERRQPARAEGRVCSAAAGCRRGSREDCDWTRAVVRDEILADLRAAFLADRVDAPIMLTLIDY